MSNYNKIKLIFENNKGKKIVTDKYEGVVCGFHFAWDDNDDNSLIVAILKEKTLRPGIIYALNGDVYVTHKQNELGYDFIHV